MTCNDCIHQKICEGFDGPFNIGDADSACADFKARSRFVELPFPISEGTKLYYIFKDIDDEIKAGKNREMVTRVCKDGFYVSGDLHCDGTYSDDDYFYPWSAIGTEYFFTLEEAEAAMKERENDEK